MARPCGSVSKGWQKLSPFCRKKKNIFVNKIWFRFQNVREAEKTKKAEIQEENQEV
jgi:hypothetical protein